MARVRTMNHLVKSAIVALVVGASLTCVGVGTASALIAPPVEEGGGGGPYPPPGGGGGGGGLPDPSYSWLCVNQATATLGWLYDQCQSLVVVNSANQIPPRSNVPIVKRCGNTGYRRTEYGYLGQTNPALVKHVYLVAQGQQMGDGADGALTGQQDGYGDAPCNSTIILRADSLVGMLVADTQLYHAAEDLIIVVMDTGGRTLNGDGPKNTAMVTFWLNQLYALTEPWILTRATLIGQSLGGGLAMKLASVIDEAYPQTSVIIDVTSPSGRKHNWMYPVDESRKHDNPISSRRRWFTWNISDTARWGANVVRRHAVLSGDPIWWIREAWPVTTPSWDEQWVAYEHKDLGRNYHPDVAVPMMNRLRADAGLGPYGISIDTSAVQACMTNQYQPQWLALVQACHGLTPVFWDRGSCVYQDGLLALPWACAQESCGRYAEWRSPTVCEDPESGLDMGASCCAYLGDPLEGAPLSYPERLVIADQAFVAGAVEYDEQTIWISAIFAGTDLHVGTRLRVLVPVAD